MYIIVVNQNQKGPKSGGEPSQIFETTTGSSGSAERVSKSIDMHIVLPAAQSRLGQDPGLTECFTNPGEILKLFSTVAQLVRAHGSYP